MCVATTIQKIPVFPNPSDCTTTSISTQRFPCFWGYPPPPVPFPDQEQIYNAGFGHWSGSGLTSYLDVNLLRLICNSAAFVPWYGGAGVEFTSSSLKLHVGALPFNSARMCSGKWGVPSNVYFWNPYKHNKGRIFICTSANAAKNWIHPSDFLEYLCITTD